MSGAADCVCGIDPGIAGGIAFRWEAGTGPVMWTGDLPVIRLHGVGPADLDGEALATLIQHYRPAVAVIEKVGSRPGQGLSSTFRFGTAYGLCIGVVGALKVPLFYVQPARWKADIGLPPPPSHLSKSRAATWRKASALDVARELYPDSAADWKRKRDHNRAEAALLAHWGHRNGLVQLHTVRRVGTNPPAGQAAAGDGLP